MIDPQAGGAVVVELAGKPIPKGRPRFGKGHAYTPAQTRGYEEALAWTARRAMKGRPIMLGAVTMSIVASIGVPQRWKPAAKAAAIAGEIKPTSKPDLDNYGKAVRDALNGIVYADDAQIVFQIESKVYAEEPGIRIEIAEIAREKTHG